jgi:hypothetical protein
LTYCVGSYIIHTLHFFKDEKEHNLLVQYSKFQPRIGHEGPEGEYSYSSSLSLTSALDGWVVNTLPPQLYPEERPGTNCIGGWVGLRAGQDGCEKSRPDWDSIPGPFSP